jgi:hypothetical protein
MYTIPSAVSDAISDTVTHHGCAPSWVITVTATAPPALSAAA